MKNFKNKLTKLGRVLMMNNSSTEIDSRLLKQATKIALCDFYIFTVVASFIAFCFIY